MQEAQEKYHEKRAYVAKHCGRLMEHTNVKWEEREKIDAKSQIEFDLNAPIKCKSNVTETCREEFLGLLSFMSDLNNDERLKGCYDLRRLELGPGSTRGNDFLIFMMFGEDEIFEQSTTMKDYFQNIIDTATQSCKLSP